MRPTDEQAETAKQFIAGNPLKINAGAGTGKTQTLALCGQGAQILGRRGIYVAFNAEIAREANGRFTPNVFCQPDGTMVRVPTRGLPREKTSWTEVSIESLSVGDLVLTWNQNRNNGSNIGVIRKRGRRITSVTKRPYRGRLVTVNTDGRESRYTPEHPCIVSLVNSFSGQYVIYMMRRGEYFKIGYCSWDAYDNRCSIAMRIKQEDADALWLLGVYDTREEVLLAEALMQHEWQIPGWCFRHTDGTSLYRLWPKINPNSSQAAACLEHYGRDIELPFWSRGESKRFGQQVAFITAAANVMDGMKMLVADNAVITPINNGANDKLVTPSRIWTKVKVTQEEYDGTVTSLEVEKDQTYIADGILTHNCSTAHSLAFRAVGHRYQHRLNDRRRYTWRDWADALGLIGTRLLVKPSTATKLLRAGLTAFTKSSDPWPGPEHLPVEDDQKGYNIARELHPYLEKAWEDISNPRGKLPFEHDHYLKMWQLSNPIIPADFILADEAQDLDPVLLCILQAQPTQIVYVGDAAQSIYQWRGAVSAMTTIKTEIETQLTQSFRFGDAIAQEANRWLEQLPEETWTGTPLRLRGLDSIDSELTELDNPHCVLTRTNAGAISELIDAQDAGKKTHLAGRRKVSELTFFVKGVMRLIDYRESDHPLLAGFKSWYEVQAHTEKHPDDVELLTLVRLVRRCGPRVMLNALEALHGEDYADIVVSTAHSAKGREWETVRIAGDFVQPQVIDDDEQGLSDEEIMLRYVAVTRAKQALDCTALHTADLTPAGEA